MTDTFYMLSIFVCVCTFHSIYGLKQSNACFWRSNFVCTFLNLRCDTPCCPGWVADNEGNCSIRLPPDYKPPMIHHCPRKDHRIPIYVNKYKNIAYLNNPGISADDWGGDKLQVWLSRDEFSRCTCHNSHAVVTAKVVDKYRNTAVCNFTVSIVDRYGPIFHQCPTNRHVADTERVIWMPPNVTDNVGVRMLTKPVYLNNTWLRPGIYNMMYTASDWDGNIANCSFRITVQDGSFQDQGNQRTDHSDPTMAISGTIVGALFVILVVMSVTILRLCRKRRQFRNRLQRQRSRQTTESSATQPRAVYDNPVFTVFNNDPPPYEIAATDKLPEYSPRVEPPSYEEIHISGAEHCSEDSLEISTNDLTQNPPIEAPVRNISFHVTGTITINHSTGNDNQSSAQINPNSIYTDV